jgi:hypothetical protein
MSVMGLHAMQADVYPQSMPSTFTGGIWKFQGLDMHEDGEDFQADSSLNDRPSPLKPQPDDGIQASPKVMVHA